MTLNDHPEEAWMRRFRLRWICFWNGHPVWDLFAKNVVPRRKIGEICMRCGKVWRYRSQTP